MRDVSIPNLPNHQGDRAADGSAPPLSSQAIQAAMRAKGLRITPQRYAVYANLLGRTDHPTAEAILTAIAQTVPMSSRATTYATLTALREAGLVREVLLEEGVTRYDANIDRHHHFRCETCGAIQDLPWETFGNLADAALPHSLRVSSYEVTVRGQCDRCLHP